MMKGTKMTLANDQLDHIYMTERLRAELAAANEFKKHYTDLISVNAELMGAPNDGSITDSVVQIEKLVKKLRDERDAVAKRLEKALVEGAKCREERDEALRNQAETQSKLDALERMFQTTCQQFVTENW